MAVLSTILNLFGPPVESDPIVVVPARPTTYKIRALTANQRDEVLRLNSRCFRDGENYTKHTFSYLLNEPTTVSYQAVSAEGEMTGFVFVMVNKDGSGHITTIGVAPEHRRRGIAARLLKQVESALTFKGASTLVLEVRVGNKAAQELYAHGGFRVTQRLVKYYSNGEDGYLMMKALGVTS
ncbi:MAG: ribosomal protein S18-alanine N-acetyltransferase [Acidobacteria bacterium]|nr:ribosomal protein S18-alanine N-acetyltransferase [Acidobacteriota bacterium]